MKGPMIVAALLSTVSALPAANGTGAHESDVAQISSAEIQDLAAKTIASIKAVQDKAAAPAELAVQVKDNLNDIESFISSISRGESAAQWPAFQDFAKGFNWMAGEQGIKGHGGQYEPGYKCHSRAGDVDDGDNDLDKDCDDDDGVAGVLGLLLEAVAETLDQLIPGLDDVVEELTDDLSTNDDNFHKAYIQAEDGPLKKGHGKGGKGGPGGKGGKGGFP